jgi:hypothetical protein
VSPSPRRGLHRNQNQEEADGCPGLHPGIFSAVPGGTVPGAHEYPGLTSWATFSRPCGTVIWTDRFSPDSEVATVAFAQFPQNGRDVKPPIGPRQVEIPGANYLRLGNSQPELPGGNCVPALVGGGVQHVDTPGVHMLGHLEDSIEFVVQGRFASRSRQRIVTRSQSNLVCTHNEYWYTSARARRKCANLTITRPRRGQRASPLERTPGYPRGEARSWPPAGDRYLQQNRWQIGQGPGLPK